MRARTGNYCGTHIVVTAKAWKWCLNEDKASPDLQISGCTTVIQWAGRPQNSARDNNEQVIRFDPLVRDDFPHLPAAIQAGCALIAPITHVI